ncbi:hypothetical protein L3X38_013867 [Prunus dulcis]|uniref:Uncharacterized protein n=1 Tax=Prunus dulcis TaxID=3755 RepID=A0AAD4WMP8_PRUDU|nr:hypothetical protein L3X38_013867 [Prunus dulcis]
MFTHGRCCEKNPTAKLYHKTRLGKLQSIALLSSENQVLEAYGLKQATIGFFHVLGSISSKPLIKSPMGHGIISQYQVLVLALYSGFRSTLHCSGSGIIQDLLLRGCWRLDICYNNQTLM